MTQTFSRSVTTLKQILILAARTGEIQTVSLAKQAVWHMNNALHE